MLKVTDDPENMDVSASPDLEAEVMDLAKVGCEEEE